MNIDELVELKKQQQKELSEAASVFKSQLTDKSISIDERWKLLGKLTKIGGVLGKDLWVCHSIDAYGLSWYDDFNVQRHEDVEYYDLTDVWEWGVTRKNISQEDYDSWREGILASGNYGFNFDW